MALESHYFKMGTKRLRKKLLDHPKRYFRAKGKGLFQKLSHIFEFNYGDGLAREVYRDSLIFKR